MKCPTCGLEMMITVPLRSTEWCESCGVLHDGYKTYTPTNHAKIQALVDAAKEVEESLRIENHSFGARGFENTAALLLGLADQLGKALEAMEVSDE